MTISNDLGQRQILLQALVSACSIANTYYAHPILTMIADDIRVDIATVALIPAVSQGALAFGSSCSCRWATLRKAGRCASCSACFRAHR